MSKTSELAHDAEMAARLGAPPQSTFDRLMECERSNIAARGALAFIAGVIDGHRRDGNTDADDAVEAIARAVDEWRAKHAPHLVARAFGITADLQPGTRACVDCDAPATEFWDYSDAPIPNPPPGEWLCESCADKRRDRWLEG